MSGGRALYHRTLVFFNVVFLFLLLFIPFRLIWITIDHKRFMENCPDDSCGSYIGIYYAIYPIVELYLILMYVWLLVLRAEKKHPHWWQLSILVVIGVLPGLVMLYPLIFNT